MSREKILIDFGQKNLVKMIYFTEHGTDGFLTTLINMHKCNTNILMMENIEASTIGNETIL